MPQGTQAERKRLLGSHPRGRAFEARPTVWQRLTRLHPAIYIAVAIAIVLLFWPRRIGRGPKHFSPFPEGFQQENPVTADASASHIKLVAPLPDDCEAPATCSNDFISVEDWQANGSLHALTALWNSGIRCFVISASPLPDGSIVARDSATIKQIEPQYNGQRSTAPTHLALKDAAESQGGKEAFPVVTEVMRTFARLLDHDGFPVQPPTLRSRKELDESARVIEGQEPMLFVKLDEAVISDELARNVAEAATFAGVAPYVAFVMPTSDQEDALRAIRKVNVHLRSGFLLTKREHEEAGESEFAKALRYFDFVVPSADVRYSAFHTAHASRKATLSLLSDPDNVTKPRAARVTFVGSSDPFRTIEELRRACAVDPHPADMSLINGLDVVQQTPDDGDVDKGFEFIDDDEGFGEGDDEGEEDLHGIGADGDEQGNGAIDGLDNDDDDDDDDDYNVAVGAGDGDGIDDGTPDARWDGLADARQVDGVGVDAADGIDDGIDDGINDGAEDGVDDGVDEDVEPEETGDDGVDADTDRHSGVVVAAQDIATEHEDQTLPESRFEENGLDSMTDKPAGDAQEDVSEEPPSAQSSELTPPGGTASGAAAGDAAQQTAPVPPAAGSGTDGAAAALSVGAGAGLGADVNQSNPVPGTDAQPSPPGDASKQADSVGENLDANVSQGVGAGAGSSGTQIPPTVTRNEEPGRQGAVAGVTSASDREEVIETESGAGGAEDADGNELDSEFDDDYADGNSGNGALDRQDGFLDHYDEDETYEDYGDAGGHEYEDEQGEVDFFAMDPDDRAAGKLDGSGARGIGAGAAAALGTSDRELTPGIQQGGDGDVQILRAGAETEGALPGGTDAAGNVDGAALGTDAGASLDGVLPGADAGGTVARSLPGSGQLVVEAGDKKAGADLEIAEPHTPPAREAGALDALQSADEVAHVESGDVGTPVDTGADGLQRLGVGADGAGTAVDTAGIETQAAGLGDGADGASRQDAGVVAAEDTLGEDDTDGEGEMDDDDEDGADEGDVDEADDENEDAGGGVPDEQTARDKQQTVELGEQARAAVLLEQPTTETLQEQPALRERAQQGQQDGDGHGSWQVTPERRGSIDATEASQGASLSSEQGAGKLVSEEAVDSIRGTVRDEASGAASQGADSLDRPVEDDLDLLEDDRREALGDDYGDQELLFDPDDDA